MLSVWGRVPGLDETIARIDAVDLATVRRIAETAAAPGKAALALYGPVRKAPDLSELTRRLAA
jgi:hypothetical protein